jgi:hypothetical protein
MATVAQAQLGISEAIQIGLRLEDGPVESLESRSVETAPRYIELMRGTRLLFENLDLEGVSERKLLQLTANLLQAQDSIKDLDSVLRTMKETGRARLAGQESLVQQFLDQTAKELDWLEDKIETLALALDSDFVAEMNRRISSSPTASAGNPDWKRDLASICD